MSPLDYMNLGREMQAIRASRDEYKNKYEAEKVTNELLAKKIEELENKLQQYEDNDGNERC